MGLPGWWTGGAQDAAFYADAGVFRPLAKSLLPTNSAHPCRS
ncbi:MAG: hypothetical protein U5L74_13760 [Ideonella sp.]|nr:hypothetical protein [Ideonella sp.]